MLKEPSRSICASNGPEVAAFSDGGYVVTWLSDFGQDVYARRYDGSGNALGSETLVNTTTTGNQADNPAVAALSDGGYVVTWEFYQLGSDDWSIYARRYDGSGTEVGSETLVNTTTSGDQLNPAVAALSDGGYVVTWIG